MNDSLSKSEKALDILTYILFIIVFIYGFYLFTRGFLAILNLIELEGLKTPYNLIIGSFCIALSSLGMIYVIAKKKEKK